MITHSTEPKPSAPSGQAVPKEAIAQKEPRVTALVKASSAPATEHTLVTGPHGRVPYFSQNPDRPPPSRPELTKEQWQWGGVQMRNNSIGSVGCGLTSAAMVLSYYGYKVTPLELNEYAQKDDAVYARGNNKISDWRKLFQYGGAPLTHKPGREYGEEELKTAEGRKTLWEDARRRAANNQPSIARVDYVSPSAPANDPDKYDRWGDHFVVIVGLHKNGKHLLINDPGRNQSNTNGNGSEHPECKENWLAEDPSDGCQKKGTGGYRLIRIDEIDGPPAVSIKEPEEPLTEENWKGWASRESKRQIDNFIPRLLQTARSVIIQEITALFAQVSASSVATYTFQPARLKLLVENEVNAALKSLHKEIGDNLLAIVREAETRIPGVSVAIKAVPWLSNIMPPPPLASIEQGMLQIAQTAIGKAEQLLDLVDLDLPLAGFAEVLSRVCEEMEELEAPELKFSLRRVQQNDRSMMGVSMSLSLMNKLSEADDWLDLETEGEVSFLFPSVQLLAEAILVKVFTAFQVIEDAAKLVKLVTDADKTRFDEILNGNVRVDLKIGAEKFKPDTVFEELKLTARVDSKVALDFFREGPVSRVAMLIDATGNGEIGYEGNTAEVELHAVGALAIRNVTFAPMWSAPKMSLDQMLPSLAETTEGKGSITLKAKGAVHTRPLFGLFRLHGVTDAQIVLGFENRNVVMDFGNVGEGHLDYDGQQIALKLAANGGMRFTLPNAVALTEFCKAPREKFQSLMTTLLSTADGRVRVEVTVPRTEISIWLIRLTTSANLVLEFRDREITLVLGAQAATAFRYGGHELRFSLDVAGTGRLSLQGGPTLQDLSERPDESFKAIVKTLDRKLRAEGRIAIQVQDDFLVGLVQVQSGGFFYLALADHEASLEFAAGAVLMSTESGNRTQLAAVATVHARLAWTETDDPLGLTDLCTNAHDKIGQLFDKLPSLLQGKVTVDVTGGVTIPLRLPPEAQQSVSALQEGLSTDIEQLGDLHFDGRVSVAFDTETLDVEAKQGATLRIDNLPLDFTMGSDCTLSFKSSAPAVSRPGTMGGLLTQVGDFVGITLGHASFVIDSSLTIDAQFPMAFLRGKLRDDCYIETLSGHSRCSIDYYADRVVADYDLTASGTTTLLTDATLTITANGHVEVPDRMLGSFFANPWAEADDMASTMWTQLDSKTFITLAWRGVVLKAHLEKMAAAMRQFEQKNYVAGLQLLWDAAEITLPNQPTRTLSSGDQDPNYAPSAIVDEHWSSIA